MVDKFIKSIGNTPRAPRTILGKISKCSAMMPSTFYASAVSNSTHLASASCSYTAQWRERSSEGQPAPRGDPMIGRAYAISHRGLVFGIEVRGKALGPHGVRQVSETLKKDVPLSDYIPLLRDANAGGVRSPMLRAKRAQGALDASNVAVLVHVFPSSRLRRLSHSKLFFVMLKKRIWFVMEFPVGSLPVAFVNISPSCHTPCHSALTAGCKAARPTISQRWLAGE
jgi:hypothetical protein